MTFSNQEQIVEALAEIRKAGLYKNEKQLVSPQQRLIRIGESELINFCSNNYLGFANHPQIINAAKAALDEVGFGMASVRFICGTQTGHIQLEDAISKLLSKEATILFPSCFDANAGIFEVLLREGDAVISDELNHASIIDGIRLSKATRYRYKNCDMQDLEEQLIAAQSAPRRLIVTDGVFSMDGLFAPLVEICDLAQKYDALVMVDDSHAVGFIGETGAGTPEKFGVSDRVDILSGTLGKALGGASGGYISSHKEIVELLRQRARTYLFSNSIPPAVVAGSLAAIGLVSSGREQRKALESNALRFRKAMVEAGFTLRAGEHAIIPVMYVDEHEATAVAEKLLERGIYVIAFTYPVVPIGKPRIRVQISAAHTEQDIDACVEAFISVR